MSELVIIRPEDSAAVLGQRIENRPGPARVVVGTGGKRLRFHDGHEVVIGGEALRHALRKRRISKPFVAGDVIHDGKEIVIDSAVLSNWLRRGAMDLGPACVVVGEEPVQFADGPSVAEQKNEAAADLHHHVSA